MHVDVRRLDSYSVETAEELVRTFHASRVSTRYIERLLADPANLLLVAEAEGRLVGFAWAHWLARLAEERQRLFVYEIEVLAEHRRKGVGTALSRAIGREAASRRSDAFLLTNRSNGPAVSFYRRLGWREKNGDDLLFVLPPGRGG